MSQITQSQDFNLNLKIFRNILIGFTVSAILSSCGTAGRNAPTIASIEDKELVIENIKVQPIERKSVVAKYKEFLRSVPVEDIYSDAQRRLADLELMSGEDKSVSDDDPMSPAGRQQLRSAIKQYSRYLRTHKNSKENELVLYQLAKAYSLLAEPEKEQSTLNRLKREFPKSKYNDEVNFRIGETYFVLNKYRLAGKAYNNIVINHKKSLFYEKAMYKYGWTLFKRNKYQQALKQFINLLDIKSAQGKLGRVTLSPGISRSEKELLTDTLRVTSLTLSYQQGARSLTRYLKASGKKPYEPLLYRALGKQYQNKDRIIDAADTYMAYVKRAPNDPDAPIFHQDAIAAYKKGGLASLVIKSKAEFIARYNTKSYYWRTQSNEKRNFIKPLLAIHIKDLATHFHASGRKSRKRSDYRHAAKWYGEFITMFPNDKTSADMNFLLAESLHESGQYQKAILEFEKTAYGYAAHKKSAEAAYAAILIYPKLQRLVQKKNKGSKKLVVVWQQKAIASALLFSEKFSQDKRVSSVLAKTSETLYAHKNYQRANQTARLLLAKKSKYSTPRDKRTAWIIIGHSEFALANYTESEKAYKQVLRRTAKNSKLYKPMQTRLAASIYKQGELAKASNNNQQAISHFLRLKKITPNSPLLATAEYDAASLLIKEKKLKHASRILEKFRITYPKKKKLQQGVTEKLAFIYTETKQYTKAAHEIEKLLTTKGSANFKRDMTLQAANLYLKGGNKKNGIRLYKKYIKKYPQPLAEAMEARNTLAEHYKKTRKLKKWGYWLKEIIRADAKGGRQRTDRTKYLAGNATLVLAKPLRTQYNRAKLRIPLKKSLKKKKRLMQKTIKAYQQALNYKIADVSTSATYQIAEIYNNFARALMKSQRPKGLSADEKEQYDILLEEQAFPFEEKAIDIHVANVKNVNTGIYNNWIKKSLRQLSRLQPVRYAKTEKVERYVDAIH
ncbi:TPR domain protein, putative component of TonB system [hydrothermal vent metagenome]|uniref:TPR domain protein, putative component of TonB system n=1 Tax=hydrothermal vent metagenome TaxID=652676 RepID=A0A3B0ZFB6_9ZZZZ